VEIQRCTAASRASFVELAFELWPDGTEADHAAHFDKVIGIEQLHGFFLACEAGVAIGFAEVSIREHGANGCETAPCAFFEGLYVRPTHRRRGVARKLHATIVAWAKSRGMTELGSDALLANHVSHAMHESLGFVETERVVYFRQPI
jgi:aminoglycoside 6'-N-acetyltransferase I